MKIPVLLLVLACCGVTAFAQGKYFEGTRVFRTTIKSKVDNLSDKDVHKVMAVGEMITATYKNGNLKESTEYLDVYSILKDKRIYFKFRKLDTLYYMEYSGDTTRVLDIVKTDSVFKICGYVCKAITIRASNGTRRIYYTDSMHLDSAADANNTINLANIYARETGDAVNLWARYDYSYGYHIDSCIRIEQKSIDDHLFDLPALPVKPVDFTALRAIPRFPGKEGAWLKYLQGNLDSKLALKYVKIAKDQAEASVTVFVEFAVGEDGSISNIQVVNKKEVNARLADEAVRVIQESPRWVPGNFYGEKLTMTIRQPVVFKVMR
jgi:hypothetical protein